MPQRQDPYEQRMGKAPCDGCHVSVPIMLLYKVLVGSPERTRMTGKYCPQCIKEHKGSGRVEAYARIVKPV